MDERGLGDGPLEQPVRLAGGTQNILLRFVRAGRTFVLRRPPPHLRAKAPHDTRLRLHGQTIGLSERALRRIDRWWHESDPLQQSGSRPQKRRDDRALSAEGG